ncbi:MAG: hypothetical protein JWO73_237 [Candidatus Taylorbacteria bacterium]|nr:hypothetical protein [Candidatus Taylorbacteria bacterium]
MNTFSIFPPLLAYASVAPLIIRVVLGLTLIHFGYRKTQGKGQSSGSNSSTYGILEIMIGIFLVVGIFTQLAAMLNVVILVIKLSLKVREGKFLNDGVNYYVLLLAMALSLLFSAPGAFAVDMLIR